MARPTKKAALSRRGVEAIDKIRANLPKIVDELLDTGFKSDRQLACPRCNHRFEIQISDPKTLQWLWERAEGKVPESQNDTGLDKLSRLFANMAKAGLTATPPALPTRTKIEELDADSDSRDETEPPDTD